MNVEETLHSTEVRSKFVKTNICLTYVQFTKKGSQTAESFIVS